MPSGKTHDWINLAFLPVFALMLWLMPEILDFRAEEIHRNAFLLWLGSYLASVFLLSPDLDLHQNRSKQNWGFLRFLWLPYSKIFKHRGISHSLFLGTLTRIFYLYALYFAGLMVYGAVKDNDTPFFDLPYFFSFMKPEYDDFHTYLLYLSAILTGFYLPALLHTLTDWISTARKRKKNRKK